MSVTILKRDWSSPDACYIREEAWAMVKEGYDVDAVVAVFQVSPAVYAKMLAYQAEKKGVVKPD